MAFVNIAKQHQDNPFFPKIYGSKILKANTKRGNPQYILVVKMEQLVPLNSSKLDQTIPHLYKQLGFKLTDADRKSIEGIKDRDPAIERKILHQKLKNVFTGRSGAHTFETSNPEFKEAMDILFPWIQKFGEDLHTGNFMVRLTSTGPQLVIIDPFGVE